MIIIILLHLSKDILIMWPHIIWHNFISYTEAAQGLLFLWLVDSIVVKTNDSSNETAAHFWLLYILSFLTQLLCLKLEPVERFIYPLIPLLKIWEQIHSLMKELWEKIGIFRILVKGSKHDHSQGLKFITLCLRKGFPKSLIQQQQKIHYSLCS